MWPLSGFFIFLLARSPFPIWLPWSHSSSGSELITKLPESDWPGWLRAKLLEFLRLVSSSAKMGEITTHLVSLLLGLNWVMHSALIENPTLWQLCQLLCLGVWWESVGKSCYVKISNSLSVFCLKGKLLLYLHKIFLFTFWLIKWKIQDPVLKWTSLVFEEQNCST